MKQKINIPYLLAAIVVCQLAGFIGSFFTFPSIGTWYAGLAKPDFNPPNWVFGPVWLFLYTIMGFSACLVWEKGFKKKEVKVGLMVFGLQLVLNTIWSIIFFGLRSPGYAFFEIVLLWLAIALTIYKFNKISRKAALLLVPYILWVSFAGVLNYYVWMLNP